MDKLNPETIRNLYWDNNYNIEQIAKKLDVSFWSLYNFMVKFNISRRDRSGAGFLSNRVRPQFILKTGLSISDEKLKIAGVMLYWAEGTLKGNTVDFANSDPQMIRVFLRFLREICGVNEERLRVYLYGYSQHNIKELKKYWHTLTKIPLSRFTQPYIRRGGSNLGNRKLLYGLVHIRYNDKRLLRLIERWINEYRIDWAGTQVAKGGRLCKRSAMPKGMVEKRVNSGEPTSIG